jgi:hypothetical protein
LALGLLPAMKEWSAREGKTLKRCITLSTFSLLTSCLFDLYCPVEIKVIKVSVCLTAADNSVTKNIEFCFAPSETIVGLVEKKTKSHLSQV